LHGHEYKVEGAIVYTAKHDRKFVGENWADKTPISMTPGGRRGDQKA
jgi:hypothetical protein